MSPYDDGWLLDCLAIELKLNDPRTVSVREIVATPRREDAEPVEAAVGLPATGNSSRVSPSP